jgi:hypothetical protein
MANLQPIDYTSKDYEAFRTDLINQASRKLPNWTDFSQSDPGVTMIELFSMVGDILSYYLDRTANEVYLPTATQRSSVMDIAKGLSYTLRPALPSQTSLVFEIQPQAQNFVIPKGYPASTEQTAYEDAMYFETDTDLTIPAGATGLEQDGSGNYLYTVTATQGITIKNEILGSSTGTPNQSFALKYTSAINAPSLGYGTVQISVNEGAGYELWTDITDAPESVPETGKGFTTFEDENGTTWIQFGDGISTKIPSSGVSNVRATYRVGGGFNTNVGAGTVKVLQSPLVGLKSVSNIVSATGGLDKETIAEAKVMAPQLLRSSARAVTKSDYETLVKSVPGVAKASAEVDAANNNQVNVTIAPVGGGLPTEELRQAAFEKLDGVKLITTQLDIKDPSYLNVNLSITIKVLDGFSQSEVRTYGDEEINDIFAFDNRDFGQGEYISRIYQRLNPLQGIEYVSVNRMTVQPRVDWITVSGNPTWSPVTVTSGNALDGKWRVKMTSATAFSVDFDSAGDGTFASPKGAGTFGSLFTSSGGELSFTITAGSIPCATNDFWTFRTTPYLGNIIPNKNEILLLNVSGYTVTMEGGYVD